MSVLSAKRVRHLSLGVQPLDDSFPGFDVYPGQTVQYLITDSENKRVNERILAKQLIKNKMNYDVEKHLELLISAADTLLGVFGYDSGRIRDEVPFHEKQLALNQPNI